MNILNQLKSHKVVEANNLVGLRSGHIVAQSKFDNAADADYLDNGHILELDYKGELALSAAGANKVQYLHYSEEHIKFLDSASLDMFTVSLEKDAYPRAIALYDGDTFTTDNVNLNADGIKALNAGAYAITVVDGLLTVGDAATSSTAGPIGEKAFLPSGKPAIKVTWRAGGNA